MQPVETFEVNGLTVKIYPDHEPGSPREWDNLGTLKLVDGSRIYGDSNTGFSNVESLMIHVLESGAVFLPILAGYDGRLSTDIAEMTRQLLMRDTDERLDELWSSKQVGIIYVEPEKLVKEYGADNAETRARALEVLAAEVSTYEQYRSGDVYGYVVERASKCDACAHEKSEQVDSCWGFYGIDDCIQAAREAAESETTAA